MLKTTTIFIENEENITFKLTYNLTQNSSNDNYIYGYNICCLNTQDNSNTSATFEDFTDDIDYAYNVFDFIVKNNVFPSHLIEVLDELNKETFKFINI